jgi:hypothetical protein
VQFEENRRFSMVGGWGWSEMVSGGPGMVKGGQCEGICEHLVKFVWVLEGEAVGPVCRRCLGWCWEVIQMTSE